METVGLMILDTADLTTQWQVEKTLTSWYSIQKFIQIQVVNLQNQHQESAVAKFAKRWKES